MTHDSHTLIEIVGKALRRSISFTPHLTPFDGGVIVSARQPKDDSVQSALQGKAMVFGWPTQDMLPALGLGVNRSLPSLAGLDACESAQGEYSFTQSAAGLSYKNHPLTQCLAQAIRQRAFTRFDYTDEWNNAGFGRICTDGSIWAAKGGFIPTQAVELAGIYLRNGNDCATPAYAGAYMTLYDTPHASILWCARPVGPVDSVEWAVVEQFLSDWRAPEMPCLPVLQQTPRGCRCLVTMRLDCDEAVASARSLFQCYSHANVPFSLAVKTSLTLKEADTNLLEDVLASGGSILSHTHNHQKNWGATYEEAFEDASTSARIFASLLPTTPVQYAVSPFHTNPPYAVCAVADAHFTGFVSGIIHNDPEYLLGRAGVVPFVETPIISISQQSMLHGDCYKRQASRVDAHITAFEAQYIARGIFGYLDHPFSERYQYDWDTEEQRVQAHKQFIDIVKTYEDVWFWSQNDCFAFVQAISDTKLALDASGAVVLETPASRSDIVYTYQGQEYNAHKGDS